jgi:hypothetical protein
MEELKITAPTPIRWQVILGGLLTTALTLAGLYWMGANRNGGVMGLYLNGLIPIGALFVGLLTASGYSIAARLLHTKVSGLLLCLVLFLQISTYFLSHYIKYVHNISMIEARLGKHLSIDFFHYYDATTRSMRRVSKYSGMQPAMGNWGYGVRLLEIIGFVGGGVWVPLKLSKSDYCNQCRVYMEYKFLLWVPASITAREANEKADTEGHALAEQIAVWGKEGDGESFKTKTIFRSTLIERNMACTLPSSIEITMTYCPRCYGGILKRTHHEKEGEVINKKKMDDVELSPLFVKQVLEPKSKP